jgi:two-component system, chemotaxis family, CheB/CheR fusion protein
MPHPDAWGLRADEVKGEPFLNLDIGFPVEQLSSPIRIGVGSGELQSTTLHAINRRGRRITCTVRCTPLRSSTDQIDGITMVMDATEQ